VRILRALVSRLRGMITSHQAEADFSAELEAHLALAIDEGIRAGLTPAEARRHALIRLGGAEQTRQIHRDRRTLPGFETLLRDLRSSFRTLAKRPAITAIAILSIGLGIGANATIFSIVSRFVLRPLPVSDPSSLLQISTQQKGDRCCNNFPLPLFQDVKSQAKTLSDVAAFYELVPASIGGVGEPERVWGQATTANFFNVLQLPMVLGRGFNRSESTAPVLVIGENLWRRRFNADPDLIGKKVLLSGRTFTVIGVAPAAFHSVDQLLYTQFWFPLGILPQMVANLPPQDSREYHWLNVIARMQPGIDRRQVVAEFSTLAASFAKSYPATDKDNSFHIEQAGSLNPGFQSTVLLFLTALSIVALLVLAIACANVANLLFAQAVSRQREMAVRLALGATRGSLRRQMLVESLLLGLGGGVVGTLLSLWATRSLSSFHLPAPVPMDISVAVDWRVLVFTAVLCIASGLLLGIAPAWSASRPLLANALRGEDALARPGRRFALRNLLVVAQIAMSVVLLSITGLFLRSLQSASGINIGFRSEGLLVLSVDPRIHGYTPERTAAFLAQLRQRVESLPGVKSAVVTDVAPLSGGNRSDAFSVQGRAEKDQSLVFADLYMASPGYFETIGTPRLSGRNFGEETAVGPKTAIVNQVFADRLFHGANPIGQHVSGGNQTYEIIGVAGNAKSRTLGEDTRPMLYRSLVQTVAGDPSLMGYTLIVQAAGNPAALSQAVRRQVYALDSGMAIYNEETMEEHVRTAFFLPHVAAILFSVFGGIGLTLAAIGLYGVMSYSVSRRTREIGIRMALGAQARAVQRLILRQGLILTCIALALGWPAAWMLAKFASNFLYGIQPHDALTFTLIPPFLAMVALFACWLPARRAAMVDPVQALRAD
jgi:putative ABC transport system permease protein